MQDITQHKIFDLPLGCLRLDGITPLLDQSIKAFHGYMGCFFIY